MSDDDELSESNDFARSAFEDRIDYLAGAIGKAIVDGFSSRPGATATTLTPAMRLSHSVFSELRFALGTGDTVNQVPRQLLPLVVQKVNDGRHRQITVPRRELVSRGARSLSVAFQTGDPHVVDVRADGDTVIRFDRPDAVAVTLWDTENAKGTAILISFVTHS